MAFTKHIKRFLGLAQEPIATEMYSSMQSSARNVGLNDAALSGWFNTHSGEVYRGVPIGPDDVVVDVGCGEGGVIGFCADLGAHVIGIDHNEESLERVRRKLAKTSARLGMKLPKSGSS